MKLPVTPEERYQWGDIEGLMWAYATRQLHFADSISATVALIEMQKHFEWKLMWGRELYEQVIADSGGGPPLDPEQERQQYHHNPRTLWASIFLNRMQPYSLLDFGAGVAGQTAALLDLCPSIKSVKCRELTKGGSAQGEPYLRERYGNRLTGWERAGSYDMDDPGGITVEAINAQEVLEHVFDLDLVLEGLRRRLDPGGLLICSFPFGDWEAPSVWPNMRGHVRLVMPKDCTELFAGHDVLACDLLQIREDSPRGWPWGWTMCAVKVHDRPFGRINWERHWEDLG